MPEFPFPARRQNRLIAPLVVLIGASLWLAQGSTVALSQVAGDEAELERLRVKAEDAMANEDADGAAMVAGFFVMDADFDQILVEIGHWMSGRNLDRLASGGAIVALGCGVWAVSMFIDKRGQSEDDKS